MQFIKRLPYVIKKIFKKQYAGYTYTNKLKPLVKKYDLKATNSTQVKKVMQVNTLIGKGGAAKVVYKHLSKKLNQKGIETNFYIKENFSSEIKNIITNEYSSNKDKRKLNFLMEDCTGWLDFFNFHSLKLKHCDRFKEADILHLHNLHGGYFNPFALPELTALKPTIWTLHDQQAFTGHCACIFECSKWQSGCNNCINLSNYPGITQNASSFLSREKERIYQNSNFTLVCPSNWLKNMVEKSILKDHDIHLIYNGVDETIFKPMDKKICREDLGLPQDKTILLYSALNGLDDPYKGPEFIYQAYEKYKDNPNIIFVVVGGAVSKKIADNFVQIKYTTNEEKMAKYYAAADLFIYPSLTDNCPLSVLESMSCETPVISFKTGGIPELIEHMETGYLADYKSTDDFINGIKIFLDPKKRKLASIKARETIIKNFTLDLMIEKYMHLYQQVLDKRNRI